jgi:hypothetical protein
MIASSLGFQDKPARPAAPAPEAPAQKLGAGGTVADAYFFFAAGIA